MKSALQAKSHLSSAHKLALFPCLAFSLACLWLGGASAARISLTNSDVIGATSFNAKGNWDSASAPAAANDYSTAGFWLRTPANTSAYTFAGKSLTVPAGGVIVWKGAGLITINNLILSGGILALPSHSEGLDLELCVSFMVELVELTYMKEQQETSALN